MKVLNTSPHHLDTPSIFQDRKMDGPNSINNHSPLTMTPKLLTLQLPMMISTTTTSHNVAHVPSDRNIVLGNNLVHGSGKSSTATQECEAKGPWKSTRVLCGDTMQISWDGNCKNLRGRKEGKAGERRGKRGKCRSISEVTHLSLMRSDRPG